MYEFTHLDETRGKNKLTRQMRKSGYIFNFIQTILQILDSRLRTDLLSE